MLAATDDGFFQHDGDLLAFVINLCAGTAAVDIALGEAAATVHMDLPPLRHRPSAVLAGAIEQQFWPVNILDTGLPTFLVSIRLAWSSELFRIPRSLLPRRDLLGISREHIYYRSPVSRGERAPGRILWYVTNDEPGGLGAIVACSRLEEVVVDSPQTLHADSTIWACGKGRRLRRFLATVLLSRCALLTPNYSATQCHSGGSGSSRHG